MKHLLAFMLLSVVFQTVRAQEEHEWKPQTHITGYANTMLEYIDLPLWKDAEKNVAIGLAEAAFLVSYKPLRNLEFKGTFVYQHYVEDIQSLVVEAYGTYSINQALKIGAGKYLTPLSPINQYFYAPLNPSASLPMLVSHHYILPQSIAGFQVFGELGEDTKFGYNLTYGNYRAKGHQQFGVLGIQGREDNAVLEVNVQPVKSEYLLGGSGRVYLNYKDMIKVGLNYFDGRRSTVFVAKLDEKFAYKVSVEAATKYSAGIDLQLNFNGLKINTEYWTGEQEITSSELPFKDSYTGYYGEVIYEAGIFSPYFRYDYVQDQKFTIYLPSSDVLYSAKEEITGYTVGIALRPMYEVLLKLEYRYMDVNLNYSDLNEPFLLAMKADMNNPMGIKEKEYSYVGLSLVYSF